MRSSALIPLCTAFWALGFTGTACELTAAVPVAESGLKSFDDWQPDKTGQTVVSDKLQAAVDWCHENQRTLYLPPGTYLVDRTIELRAVSNNSNKGKLPYIHGDAYKRPVIRLRDGSFTGAPVPEAATPVVRLRHVDWNHPSRPKGSAWLFFCVFANLNFDLGDNAGACALYYAAAQDSHLLNIAVTGRHFTAGFVGLPGRNAGNVNLEVTGGRFGIVMNDAVGINLTGVRLVGQSEAAVKVNNWDGSTIVGLESSGPGPALVVSPGTNSRQGRLYVLDARIEITNPANCAIVLNDRPAVLRHVYVKGTEQIVAGDDQRLSVAAGPGWAHVRTYASAPALLNDKPTFNHLDGVRQQTPVIEDVTVSPSAPADLRTRHLPAEIFAFNHPDAVNALRFPGATLRAQIQAALDGPDRVVYVPRGHHELDGPLRIAAGKVLLGDPGKTTFLVPAYTPEADTYIVETADAAGFVVLQDLYLGNRNLDFDGALHWRTSNGFILNLRGFLAPSNTEKDVRNFKFSGRAGGRFYGIAHHRNIDNRPLRGGGQPPPDSDRYRKFLFERTSNPITFYGLNVERGGEKRDTPQPAPFVEMIGCRNIRVLGAKTEPDTGPAFALVDSRNISLVGLNTHRETGYPLLSLGGGCADIELALIGNRTNSRATPLIEPFADITEAALVVLFRQGGFAHTEF